MIIIKQFTGRRTALFVCVFLAAAVLFVFGRALQFGFVNYDDNKYVYENPVVQKGLTGEGFRWALTFNEVGHWHPVTWLSHMLDCQIYGVHAWGHHLTNILLHCAAAILLFLLLRLMTGSLWGSAFVAAAFAVHPLRAESVAWVSERKDVLSAFFFMLVLWAYVRYVRRPFSVLRYGLVALVYALGLLSKDMLVTLPFVLLLLDYWPLGRFSGRALWLAAEKIPLLILSAGSCAATLLAPEKISIGSAMPLYLRLENAVVSYVIYLRQIVWPSGLSCVYPDPVYGLPFWEVAGAAVLLSAMTAAAVLLRKKQPAVFTGWFWYLGMMAPVIGIVQISFYAHADRYTYLPSIGILVIVAWGLKTIADTMQKNIKPVVKIASAAALVALCGTAWRQVGFWKNPFSLFSHAIAVTKDNYIAYNHLSYYYEKTGQLGDAMEYYRKSLGLRPDQVDTHNRLGILLGKTGHPDEAMAHFLKVLDLDPSYGRAHFNIAFLLAKKGQTDGALDHYTKALEINPKDDAIYNNMGILLVQTGRTDEAIARFRTALEINPNSIGALRNCAFALEQKGQLNDAISLVRKAYASARSGGDEARVNMVAQILSELDQAINSSQVK